MSQQSTKDSESIRSVIRALYEVISGDDGEPRDWKRKELLFYPGGRLYIAGEDGETRVFSPGEYARDFSENLGNPGVNEIEEDREEYIYGNLATVVSHYATFKQKRDKSPYKRGVNLLQMIHSKGRWWILSIAWDRNYNKIT